ncbi:MAG: methyltransferase domain-containing protein [Actinobacteria bacterium]|jgi:SAM-dependent methyltransferase|nr:methyltransferase domain-containing protein [Actinomycetota bacterium]
MSQSEDGLVEVDALRAAVQEHYAEVAHDPVGGDFHFHTGRAATERLGYPDELLEHLADACIEAFAGVANPFAWGLPRHGERVVDIGSGGGLDSMVAARAVGPDGFVVGVDMTPAMLERARRNARAAGIDNIEFREGLAEALPVEDGWADLVVSNGVLNLVPDKVAAYGEIIRALRPGGRIQIADVCVEVEVPRDARADIDLWKG